MKWLLNLVIPLFKFKKNVAVGCNCNLLNGKDLRLNGKAPIRLASK